MSIRRQIRSQMLCPLRVIMRSIQYSHRLDFFFFDPRTATEHLDLGRKKKSPRKKTLIVIPPRRSRTRAEYGDS